MTDEILPVRKVQVDGGDFNVTCPHCKQIVGVDPPFLGEQFQHRVNRFSGCGGWFEVVDNARVEGI